jgi:sporulation killing factor system integral membrane protein
MAGAIYIEAARQGGLAAGFATSLPSSFADALGAAMLGRPNLAGGLGICIIAVLGLLLMFAGTGPALRERISLDASFWADFSIGSSAAAASGSSGNKETWRGGTRLTGPAALTWFEIATLRRANFHVTGYSLLLVSAWLVGSYEPAFIILFILGTAGSVLTRAYLSGAILHLRLGNFALYPGGLLAKVCAAELPHAAASTLALALSLTLAGLAARFNWTLIADLVTLGISTVVLAFGIRILCGALAFLSSTNVPPSLFFLNVFATSAVLAAAIFSIFEVQRKLELPFNPELLPVAVAGIGVVSFAAGIRLLRKQLFHRRANKTSNTDRKRTGNCARNSSGHC